MGYPEGFWTKDIEGYVDNKTYLVPTSKAKKETLLKQKVTGHLRKPSEGDKPEFPSPLCPARR